MKLIVTGATGFIGSEVVRQCIANPAVDSITVVSRREPAKEVMESSKVKVVLLPNFSQWPASLLDQLEGAEGCIWYVKFLSGNFELFTHAVPKDCWRQSSRFSKL
jgi:uncharacterized protein YbjT (DUF2867 family)